MNNEVIRMLRRAASRGAIAAGLGAISIAAGATPAVYFNEDLNAGRTAFLNTAAAADAAYNAAHPGATQSSTIFHIDLTNSIGSQFSVLDSASGTTVYVRTTRGGSPALNNTTGDAGGDGFTGWSVGYTPGDFSSAIAAGYNMSFYSDASYTTPYLINAIGLNVSDWGTCCTFNNTTPNGGTADASQIYMLFNGSTPLLLGGISSSISGTEHFIAAIDDRNAFSSVTMVPNGRGEYFGAGGELFFSTLQLNSVPANSSVVTVGGGLPTTTSDIVQTVSYTPADINTGVVNPVFDGGTLNLDQDGTITPDVTITNSGGTIDTQGHDVTVSGNVDDAAGASGALVKTGAGTLTLTGTSGYTGGTTVMDGTLRGGTGSLRGNIANGATLEFAQDSDGGFGGDITGTGTVVKSGTGNVAISTAQGYTGTTTIGGGTLSLTGAGDISTSGNIDNAGTFDIAGTSNGAAIRSISGNGGVTLGNKSLTVTNGTGNFGGTIQGSGGMTLGGGTLMLTGAQTYTGDTVINGGATLGLGGNGALAGTGRVMNSGTFDISSANHNVSIASIAGNGTVALGGTTLTLAQSSGAYAGNIGGTGGLTVAGGNLTLTGANGFSGGLRVDNAIVRAGADTALGNGAISIGNAMLQATGGFTSAKAVALTATTSTIDTGANAVALSGAISGTGILNKTGAGTLTLSGTNAARGINVAQGTVVVASQAAAGASDGDIWLRNDGKFVAGDTMTLTQKLHAVGANAIFDTGANNVTLAGVADGDQCLTKTGSGMLNLTAAASNAIGACVQQGTLSFNNSFAGNVTVFAAGTAGGSGQIAGNMMVIGTLAPGNSPGRLVVAGSVMQMAGSTFALDIDGTTAGIGAGHFDTLVLTGASSVYTANGAIAPRVRGITGSATNTYTPAIGQTFQVVTAEGGVTGAYTSITQPTDGMLANSRFDVIYGANSVTLAVTAKSYATLLTGNASANTVNAGAAIDAVRPAAIVRDGGNAGRLSRGLVGLSTTQVAHVVEQAAGEMHADGIDTVLQSNRVARAAISDHLGEAAGANRLWGIGIGEFGHVDGDANGRRYKTSITGMVAGYDRSVGENVVLGVAASYGHAKASNAVSGSSRTSSYRGAAYGSWQQDGSFVNAIVAGGADRYHIRRTIDLATGTQRQASDPKGWSWSADAEAGHRFEARNATITPTVGMAYDSIERDALTETGDAATALRFGTAHRQALLAKAGLKVAVAVPVGAVTLSPYGSASVWHELSDRNASLLGTLDGAAVRINAASLGRTAGRIGAGVNAQLSESTALRVGYRTTFLGNAIVNSVNGGLSIRW